MFNKSESMVQLLVNDYGTYLFSYLYYQFTPNMATVKLLTQELKVSIIFIKFIISLETFSVENESRVINQDDEFTT